MGQNSGLFLTLSRHGIWYYQRWLPTYIRRFQSHQKNLFRASLRTKSKGEAIRLSRILSVHIDSTVQEFADRPEKLFDALDTLRSNLTKGVPPAVPAMTNGLVFRGGVQHQDAINAELRRFRDGNNKLLTKFSELLETVPVKNHSTVGTTILDDDNPMVSKLFKDWVGESTMRKNCLDSTYKSAIDLFIRFVNHLHEGTYRTLVDTQRVTGLYSKRTSIDISTMRMSNCVQK